jgi:hypothetical protein
LVELIEFRTNTIFPKKESTTESAKKNPQNLKKKPQKNSAKKIPQKKLQGTPTERRAVEATS